MKPSTKKRLWGILRHVLTLAGGYLVAKGKIDASAVDIIIGAITAAAGTAASIAAPEKSALPGE
jgi:hypothetical protein